MRGGPYCLGQRCGFGAAWLVNSLQRSTGGHISTEPRINDRIRVPEVRLVGPAGEQVGIVRIEDAMRLAREAELDLVEVAPMARPPVVKLMDYGKFKYGTPRRRAEADATNQHSDQGNEAAAEDRQPRLRDQEGPRRALPESRRQGQDHDHVPRT